MIVKAVKAFRNSGAGGPYGEKSWQQGEQAEVLDSDPLVADNLRARYLVVVPVVAAESTPQAVHHEPVRSAARGGRR